MLVGIIGCGPAGLLAAHAVERNGHDVIVIAPKQKSEVFRAQCLWREIPGTATKPLRLEVQKLGNKETYASRLYGSMWSPSSWDHVAPGMYEVWPLDKVYDQLWESFESRIGDMTVTAEELGEILTNYELVINTAPSETFCHDRLHHHFDKVHTQILRAAGPETSFWRGLTIMNGMKADQPGQNWYRMSSVRGEDTWEYADGYARVGPGLSQGIKPVKTNCDCWQEFLTYGLERPKQLHRIGRFGKWEQGVMNHHAFFDTTALLANSGLGRST